MGKKIQIPAEIKRMTMILVIAYLLNFIGFTLLLSTLALKGKELLTEIAGDSAAGLPMTVLSGVALFSAIPFATMADRLGRKIAITLMIICYGIGDILGIMAINTGNGYLFLAAMIILGIGVGSMALFATAVTDLYPANYKGRASGYAQLGVMGANVVGYLFGSQIAASMGITAVYFIAALSQAAAIGFIWAINKEPKEVGKELVKYWPSEAFVKVELDDGREKKEEKGRSVLQLLVVWPLLLSVFLRVAIHLGANFVNMALPLAFTEMGYSLSMIGIFMTIRAVGSFVAASPVGGMIDKYGRKFGFISAPLVTVIGILLVGLVENMVCIIIGVFLIGVGNAIANVVPPAVANDVTTKEERSKAVAIFGISTNIGGFVFPVPMALVLARFGLSGLAIACSIFLLLPTVLGVMVKETAATKA